MNDVVPLWLKILNTVYKLEKNGYKPSIKKEREDGKDLIIIWFKKIGKKYPRVLVFEYSRKLMENIKKLLQK